ncbi:MAG: hypothetical protein JWP87_2884 [Labilithrix sp.]|nr:hypothetical protein [Labilithrix sp.]
MREEHGDLVEDRGAARLGLLPRSGNADDDVAENMPGERAELTLVHREREHVRGTILSTIEFVQLMDAFVVS